MQMKTALGVFTMTSFPGSAWERKVRYGFIEELLEPRQLAR